MIQTTCTLAIHKVAASEETWRHCFSIYCNELLSTWCSNNTALFKMRTLRKVQTLAYTQMVHNHRRKHLGDLAFVVASSFACWLLSHTSFSLHPSPRPRHLVSALSRRHEKSGASYNQRFLCALFRCLPDLLTRSSLCCFVLNRCLCRSLSVALFQLLIVRVFVYHTAALCLCSPCPILCPSATMER